MWFKKEGAPSKRSAIETCKRGRETDKLVEFLQDSDVSVSNCAWQALMDIGVESVPALTQALEDPRSYLSAVRALAYGLTDNGRRLDDDLRQALEPAKRYLVAVVEGAKILPGVDAYEESVSAAVNALRFIGDSSALPALEGLLAKVRAKIAVQGNLREYVDAGNIRGFVTTQDSVLHLEAPIRAIRENPNPSERHR